MLLRTKTKEAQRDNARQLLRHYFGDTAPTAAIITEILEKIQRHDAKPGEKRLRAKLVERPTHSRRVYEIPILGKLFRVTYDNRHKELADLYPVEDAG